MSQSTTTYLSLFLAIIPMIGFVLHALFNKNSKRGAQLATAAIGVGLALSFMLLVHCYGDTASIYFLGFKADSLGFLMTTLIFFVSVVVHQFSIRYMAGDLAFKFYFYKLSLITSSAVMMVLADHVIVFLIAWCVTNLLLISLMIHKQTWAAAAYSGKLAFKTLFRGAIIFSIALGLMYLDADSSSISMITQKGTHSPRMFFALILCIITAMSQSALWPFHRWLTSSLNSPTPVSAIMHAGIVNGGGFLLVRFAPLLVEYTLLLNFIFCVGVISAILGTLWKLVQSDVKRMLACSTMGQMGFMMIQCGLGLFSAAIAHLILHGLFKAFLFLSAGSAVQSKKTSQNNTSSRIRFVLASIYGLLGAFSFAWFSAQSFFTINTSLFLLGFAFIAATQVAYSLLQEPLTFIKNLLAIAAAFISGMVYGCSIHLIEAAVPSITMAHHPVNSLHVTAFIVFILIWLLLNLDSLRFIHKTSFWKRCYFLLLNGSQPHPKTITSIRQSYQY